MANSVIDVQKTYLAYFGRPADYVGLNYWMNSDAATMRAGFAASAEYATLYSGMTADQRVEQVYQNLLGRASDAVGKAYWVGEFNAGRETVSSLAVSMQTNALGIDIGTIANRVTYAILFTAQMDTPAEVVGYSGTAAADAARGAVSAVTYTEASLATARSTLVADVASVMAGVDPSVTPAETPDTTAPTMSSAAVATNGLSIVVTYSEALTGTAEPGDYAVTLSANSTTVTGATIGSGADANKVTLTVSNTIPQGVTVTNLVYTATAGTANSIKDAAANSAATQTLASVTNSSTATALTFTLTTANDSFTGAGGNDTFNGTFSDGGTNTFNAGDTLNGGTGTNTLNIAPNIADTAITLADADFANKTNMQNLVFASTGAGVQTITGGANFNTAFAAGVNLTATSTGGAINLALSAVTVAETLTTTSGAGAQTITTGSGVSTVTATSDAGALTIKGAGLATVSATTTGAGAQTIGDNAGNGAALVTVTATSNSGAQTITSTSGNAVTVNATSTSGAQTIVTGAGADSVTTTAAAGTTNTITTGAGNDTIVASLGNDTITGGDGADAINGGTGADVFDYNATTEGGDTITAYTSGTDSMDFDGLLNVAKAYEEVATVAGDITTDANVIVFGGSTDIATAATNIAADITVTGTVGLIVLSNGTDTFVYHTTDLGANGTETLMVTLSGITDPLTLVTGDFVFV